MASSSIENAAKDAQGQGEVLGDNASPEEVAIAMRERFDAIAAAPEMSGHDVGALRRRLHEHEGALATIAGEPQPPPIESAVPPPPGDGAGNPGGGGGGGGRPPQQLSAFEKAAAAGACLYVGLPPPLCETLIALFNEIFDLSGGDIERVIAVAAGAIGSDGSVDGFDPNRLFEDFREAGFEDPEQARRALEGFVQEARRNGSLTGDIGPITDALNRLNLGGIRECIQGARDSIVAQAQTDLALVLPGGQRQFLMDRLGEYVQSLPRVCDEAVRSPVLGAGPPLGHKACVVNTILFHARPPLAPEPVGCSLILRLDNVAP